MKKSILITGCSSGIGYDAAHGMRDAGWRVFASCRRQADCDRLIAEGFESPLLDYNDTATLESGLAEVLAATGGTLDALFNNGGFGTPGAAEDLPRDALRANFETNVFGVHDLTTRVIPVMRAQGHGRIVNHSSVLGLVAMRWRSAYNATKFALEGLTDTLRLEMADTEIKIVTMNTGPVTSDIRKKSIPHFEKWIDWENSPRRAQYESTLRKRLYQDSGPDKFELPASAVTAKLLTAVTHPNPKPRYYVTTPTYLMGFFRRILPTRALDWVLRKG
ncbi:SDR family NAD(P)-dependent oxidoreductase [Octadecabacter sp. 1_MG-2023]|uniref:SDR family NAD(P)-dependent oxidoreductase n=1 Tax=unclassified Octadecabacter TaxID=196158 RepID=UPI001C09908C|nr:MULTISPECIES: SDR family NAD(P)-dependent oxidoreductase [unclassified Octadecabacter]MBU2992634.1 SDR family NAD(P)-dependent oxidoreductase [Octadecabacter sp. B2R22]MDO6734609.1 SDR family NAD(P)-dependent oxidoreductase [Octadecabacter sp. 1_MG-2023]